MIAIGVAVMIIALKGDLHSFVQQGKAIASSQPSSSGTQVGATAPTTNPAAYQGLAPGSPGSGITVQ